VNRPQLHRISTSSLSSLHLPYVPLSPPLIQTCTATPWPKSHHQWRARVGGDGVLAGPPRWGAWHGVGGLRSPRLNWWPWGQPHQPWRGWHLVGFRQFHLGAMEVVGGEDVGGRWVDLGGEWASTAVAWRWWEAPPQPTSFASQAQNARVAGVAAPLSSPSPLPLSPSSPVVALSTEPHRLWWRPMGEWERVTPLAGGNDRELWLSASDLLDKLFYFCGSWHVGPATHPPSFLHPRSCAARDSLITKITSSMPNLRIKFIWKNNNNI
jgi:hypothetical protein